MKTHDKRAKRVKGTHPVPRPKGSMDKILPGESQGHPASTPTSPPGFSGGEVEPMIPGGRYRVPIYTLQLNTKVAETTYDEFIAVCSFEGLKPSEMVRMLVVKCIGEHRDLPSFTRFKEGL